MMLIIFNSEMLEIYIRVCVGNEKFLKIDCKKKEKISCLKLKV